MTDHHRNNFDCLRLIGALLVLYSHQFALAGREEPTILPSESLGGLGVLIFFSISGFLVQMSWDRDPNPARFLSRRFLRVWPGLAVAVAIGYAVIGPIFAPVDAGSYFRDPRYRAMLANLWFATGDPAVFTTHAFPGLNGSIWTIPKEVACYVALAVAGRMGLLNHRLIPVVAVCLTVALYATIGGEAGFARLQNARLFYPVWFGAFFLAGLVIAQNAWLVQRFFVPMAAIAAASAALIWKQNALALWCLVPVLSVWFGRAAWPVCTSAGKYGDFSYGIYLWAWPMQQIVVEYVGPDAPIWSQLMASLGLTWAAAALSWFCVERFALRIKPSGLTARR
jgi:peptidoglycan/LPS O-acetylase OafA/YrhL